MKPPEFLGGLNPIATHDWLSGMERVFQDICYSKEEKVIFAAQMMKGLDNRDQNRPGYKKQGRSGQYQKPQNSPSKRKSSYGDQSSQPPQCDNYREGIVGVVGQAI
ncbi:hypothetical protein KIW84_041185 [Lathyrus oleraceus]|uniref:Uncharacterized protein n=1 Tax=Pisum sativum TaxID=3888 RepID=A0A9D4X929_PEA|nr:hypothetical protein KIW84_041185 [Pisum sativum]